MTSIYKLKQDIVIQENIFSQDFVFYSTWGLFSPTKIDEGSRILLRTCPVMPDDKILDIGCGYGALGIPLAYKADKGVVFMVDKDFIAIKYAQKNSEANRIANTTTLLSNGFSGITRDCMFTLVISNLPAKVGKELLTIMTHDAYSHLESKGRICVVTIIGLHEWVKREFNSVFGNYKKLAHNRRYVISSAEKI